MTKINFKLFPKKSSELAPSGLAQHPCMKQSSAQEAELHSFKINMGVYF